MQDINKLILQEQKRQEETLMMIPSENYTYPEVRKVVGSILMQKYAEGQPNKRYYQGNEFVDQIETICEENALKAFGLSSKDWSANVQPYSGSPANLAVYNAILNPGDKIMSMYLPDGGHLSHGWQMPERKITLVSKIFNVEYYKIDPKTCIFDYAEIEKQVLKFKPKLMISGGTAYPREINHKKMSEIAKKVGAYYMADIAHEAGLIAGGANSSPFPYADFVTMTTHKTLRGPRGAIIICRKEFEEGINSSIFPGLQGGPHMHTIAGIAIALRNAQGEQFKKYAFQTVKNAKLLAESLTKGGLEIVSGGTDKHLVLVDLRSINTNGWTVAWALEAAGIIANRNTVPFESASPFYPSGLRLGTPAITVRGMKEKEMKQIAKWILAVIDHIKDEKLPESKEARITFTKDFRQRIAKDKFLAKIASEVKVLCKKFKMP
ncbi:MAG TPA: serine hydroxymethyltransferase [Alphaproteobacteria bacterium]|jgi:glycine hydroxymethyltransferase|nr:serine hydroxymethyltransferase [Alphaproteobacteria bacterium]